MEQFNTIPTSGNWADIAGILDANFLRCWTALVQSQSLIGLDGSNYKGMYTSASALPDDMTEAGWALVGTSLSALQLYVFNDGATDWALFSNETYNFTSWTEFQTQLDALSTQVATIGSKIGDLASLKTTDKSSAVSAINEIESSLYGDDDVSLDMADYELVNGAIANGYFYMTANWGLYHRCKFVPVSQYIGRTLRIYPTITSGATVTMTILSVMPDITANNQVSFATGYSGTVDIAPNDMPYNLVIPNDANCVYFYVRDTRNEIDKTPQSLKVMGVEREFCKLSDLEGINTSIAEIESQITTERTEPAVLIGQSDGYVVGAQTIGEQVVLNTNAGFGKVYQYEIPAKAKAKVTFSNQSGMYGYALCTPSGVVIEFCLNSSGADYTFAEQNVATVLYASSNKLSSAEIIVKVSMGENLEEMEEELAGKSDNIWKGKTIWWCGTSIPAGSDATIPGAEETVAGNYPTEVGNDLAATVINKAVGGSMCRANVRTGDYVGASFANITSCLTMTKEEIENFISNYSTIKDVLTGGAQQTLDSSYLARLRAASFEDRLLPYLNGTYPMPDLFVIDHGHNDFKYLLSDNTTDIGLEPTVANIGGELAEDTYMTANNNAKLESFFGSLADIPSAQKSAFIASVNRNCYKGAVNFIITLILHYNPHARIIFISNYEHENGVGKVYAPLINAQEDIAKSWAFPLCKIYEYLGYSDHIIPNSMSWFNTTYPNVTPATTDITVYRAYLPDGVHPHSDTTGDANNIYAGVISEFIKRIR